MKTLKQIKEALKSFRVSTASEMDQRVREKLTGITQESIPNRAYTPPPSIWTVIVKSDIFRWTAAAIIILVSFQVGYRLKEDRSDFPAPSLTEQETR